MRTITKFALLLTVIILSVSCEPNKDKIKIVVENTLDMNRSNETVQIPVEQLKNSEGFKAEDYVVTDENSNPVLSQWMDENNDGTVDKLIFQPTVSAKGQGVYYLTKGAQSDTLTSKVFSRFVPERTDDYAWENDKVAFRTYGPVAQQMVEEGTPGGTLSSGIDCWLKKVDYPIINKWYKKHTSGEGSYHEDTGEGLDNFHVGPSRGCGGLGVFKNGTLYTSKNFTGYKTLANGPIRTEFTLDYNDWKAGNTMVNEKKNIELDLGSNLMKITAEIEGADIVSAGLTLHEKDGKVHVDSLNYFASYWEPHGNSELGTGIVVKKKYFNGFTKIDSDEKDQSHILVHLKVVDGKVEYYAGFGWKEAGTFSNHSEWDKYLERFAQKLHQPLRVSVVN